MKSRAILSIGWEKHEKGERDYPESLKTNIKQNFKER